MRYPSSAPCQQRRAFSAPALLGRGLAVVRRGGLSMWGVVAREALLLPGRGSGCPMALRRPIYAVGGRKARSEAPGCRVSVRVVRIPCVDAPDSKGRFCLAALVYRSPRSSAARRHKQRGNARIAHDFGDPNRCSALTRRPRDRPAAAALRQSIARATACLRSLIFLCARSQLPQRAKCLARRRRPADTGAVHAVLAAMAQLQAVTIAPRKANSRVCSSGGTCVVGKNS